DFALYDDAFLTGAKNHAIPILEGIIGAGINVRFHTPNAIHIREISGQTADLMFKAGFQTIRLGLETTLFEKRSSLDHKVSEAEFKQAILFLKEAGFSKNQVGAYLLAGLPGQDTGSIIESIKTVKESGITPVPAYYSPIPHTGLWEKAVLSSRYDLKKDPVFTNNAIFPCRKEGFSWEIISLLKKLSAE
ncbi:MAG: B12-binding domain-containing radical SAM protein, partial [Desulfobacterales bacterium]|nr:B12-binding domain-containing radical SAM protein [Desulfobacterales bacterium]